MPNWCMNHLYISGPEEDISKFKAKANGPEQTYHNYRTEKGTWPIHDDIRLKAMYETPPEVGDSQIFSFHALHPVPEAVRRLPYGGKQCAEIAELLGVESQGGGYNWEVSNWGCKWGASESSLDSDEPSFLQYRFDTAWGPPIEFLNKVAEDWTTLSFEIAFEEPGMNFAGKAEWYDGICQIHDTWEMEDDEDDEEDSCE